MRFGEHNIPDPDWVSECARVALYNRDCRELLPTLPDDLAGACVTDPPWDQARGIPGADDPRGLFASTVAVFCPARFIVQLGCYTDPTFLAPVAARLKFLHTCWLEYAVPSYRGRVLVNADVAYCFGEWVASAPGRRVIPSKTVSTAREAEERAMLRRHGRNRTSATRLATDKALAHPMSRHLKHVRWLVQWHTEDADVVVDPFLGSGTTAMACVHLGRRFIGCEVHPDYFKEACRRTGLALKQGQLFEPVG